ncbi:hypothetical protein [Spirillospora sp. NPDC047279]|uniref:hypothetical protein n=1 Tax=Spirillospora sp. NPDC047279 TaxID=3155478 RepID=UPI00340F90A5
MKTTVKVPVEGRDVQLGDLLFDSAGIPCRITRFDPVHGLLREYFGEGTRVAYHRARPIRVITPQDRVVLLLHRGDVRCDDREVVAS